MQFSALNLRLLIFQTFIDTISRNMETDSSCEWLVLFEHFMALTSLHQRRYPLVVHSCKELLIVLNLSNWTKVLSTFFNWNCLETCWSVVVLSFRCLWLLTPFLFYLIPCWTIAFPSTYRSSQLCDVITTVKPFEEFFHVTFVLWLSNLFQVFII